MNFKVFIILIAAVLIIGVGLLTVSLVDLNKISTSFFGASENLNKADINNDGLVDQNDINEYKILYKNKDIRADIDQDGQITDNDIAQYIALYRSNN